MRARDVAAEVAAGVVEGVAIAVVLTCWGVADGARWAMARVSVAIWRAIDR